MKPKLPLFILALCAAAAASAGFLPFWLDDAQRTNAADPKSTLFQPPYIAPPPPTIPMPSPTPTPATVNVSAVGTSFSPALVAIHVGDTVVFDSTFNAGHTVYIDNGAGSCAASSAGPFPFAVTFTSAGTFSVHCSNHSACGTSTCGPSCTGMVMTVQVT